MLRGGGCLFGPDITNEIIKKNNFELIIRSHECKQNGYEYTHDNKVLTIFSASNYYEYGSNNGAYVKLCPNMKPIISQFHIKQGKEVTKNLTMYERASAIERSAINSLLERFAANKIRLTQEFKIKDPKNTGKISLNDWCNVVSEVLALKLPWRTLKSKLVQADNDGLLLYMSTFEGLSIPSVNANTINVN
jgi:serine/threonine-protein phosphatase with EF-hands